ncbi:MAG: hypothetical protein ACXADA_00180 [Candidatus Hodarchaeales archaeon]|jgi:hypothetical protein
MNQSSMGGKIAGIISIFIIWFIFGFVFSFVGYDYLLNPAPGKTITVNDRPVGPSDPSYYFGAALFALVGTIIMISPIIIFLYSKITNKASPWSGQKSDHYQSNQYIPESYRSRQENLVIRYCDVCGIEIIQSDLFCSNCGEKIT